MVSILFRVSSRYPVNRKRIRQAIEKVLAKAVKRDSEVSISFVGDRQILKLNLKYRNRDYPTDVLSFSLNESKDPAAPFIVPPDNILRLGDIVVSYPQVILEARKSNRLVDDVVDELVLHGLNHLLGIHHDEE